MVYKHGKYFSAYSPAELVQIRKDLMQCNADLRATVARLEREGRRLNDKIFALTMKNIDCCQCQEAAEAERDEYKRQAEGMRKAINDVLASIDGEKDAYIRYPVHFLLIDGLRAALSAPPAEDAPACRCGEYRQALEKIAARCPGNEKKCVPDCADCLVDVAAAALAGEEKPAPPGADAEREAEHDEIAEKVINWRIENGACPVCGDTEGHQRGCWVVDEHIRLMRTAEQAREDGVGE